MAFTSAITDKTVIGNLRMHYGTYTSSGGGTGGNIETGLSTVNLFVLQPKGSAVATNGSVVNETFPLTGSPVTIVSDADQVGQWMAVGL